MPAASVSTPETSFPEAAPIDPFACTAVGEWRGCGVWVRRVRSLPRMAQSGGLTPSILTAHLYARRSPRGLIVMHRLAPNDLSDRLATIVAELDACGFLRGQPEFEMVMTGLVQSTVLDPTAAWLCFYANSIGALEDGSADFSPVHEHAHALVHGRSLIDLGSCFGFFPLRMSAAGMKVTASDLSSGTMSLLSHMTGRLSRPVSTLVCDAARVPLPARSADTVTALHLIEHLSADASVMVLDEAARLARQRVVVAVPFERELRECFGHRQTFNLGSLRLLGEQVAARHRGLCVSAHEFHGGWLVFDR